MPSKIELWAKPIKLVGVPNLHKVSDDLYRSAQPTKTGMKNLKDLGIETIINLRSFHSDRDEIGLTGLAYEHIYMKAWHPECEDIIRFLEVVMNTRRTPCLVHCMHGADRTGIMCAIYRIIAYGWSKSDAIQEMIGGGFSFHTIFNHLADYVKELDIDSVRNFMSGSKCTSS